MFAQKLGLDGIEIERAHRVKYFHVVIYSESLKLVPEIDNFVTNLRPKFVSFE